MPELPPEARAEQFLGCACYGKQYGDHETVCEVCPLAQMIRAVEQATEQRVLNTVEVRLRYALYGDSTDSPKSLCEDLADNPVWLSHPKHSTIEPCCHLCRRTAGGMP